VNFADDDPDDISVVGEVLKAIGYSAAWMLVVALAILML
jgi:hypothetical protein